MRHACVFFVAACVAFFCSYEVLPQETPDLRVIKYRWVKDRIGWEGNPLNATVENGEQARERARTERRVMTPLQDRLHRERVEELKEKKDPPRYVFVYKVIVQNDSPKSIKEIDWDYVFTDTTTGELHGRREFTSVVKIGAGKKKELAVRISSPPTETISVYKLGENEGAGLTQTVVVLRVLYEDGTEWKAN